MPLNSPTMTFSHLTLMLALGAAASGMPVVAQPSEEGKATSITVHNGGFAVVRETLDLELIRGINQLSFTDVTAHLEPDSVILRDVSGKRRVSVLEQNYRNDPVSQQLLLSLYEGQTIDFLVGSADGPKTIRGRIVRSGYVPHREAWSRYGQAYIQRQSMLTNQGSGQPIIEVDGQLRFSLPGQPIFPGLDDDSVLKPTLHWQLQTDRPGTEATELTYISGGMSWNADYNLVAPEGTQNGTDKIDITGWVTVDNNSGRTFGNVDLKLMAGDVNKIDPNAGNQMLYARAEAMRSMDSMAPQMTEKAFDEMHLYTVARTTSLRDRETKQIEMMRAEGVNSKRLYIYDGAAINGNNYRGWNAESIRQDRNYGTVSNNKVWVMREFENTKDNGLGMPLPRGRMRFYRQDSDGALEFVGENVIDHTPKDETIRVYTGNVFDLVGERTQTSYNIDTGRDWLDESFEIELRNRKDEAVEVIVVEHLYRWVNWEVREATDDFEKTDARTIEFRVRLEAGEEKKISYTAHYTW